MPSSVARRIVAPRIAAARTPVEPIELDGKSRQVMEHGLAGDEKVRARQHRIEPINRRLAGGCHLTLDHWAAIRQAGFVLDHTTTEMTRGTRTHSCFYVGVSWKPAAVTS